MIVPTGNANEASLLRDIDVRVAGSLAEVCARYAARGLTPVVVFAIIGALLVGAWGSFAVVGSINSEISERTWDQQRLSALSPWQMAWGKLLGSSIYPWFGGAICAAVACAAATACCTAVWTAASCAATAC